MAKQKVDLDVIYDEMDTEDELKRRDIQALLKAHQRLVLFEQKWDLNSDITKIPTVCRSIILDFIEAREFIRDKLLIIRSEKLDLTGKRNIFSDDCESATQEVRGLAAEFKRGIEYLIYQINEDPVSYHDFAEYESVDEAFERHIKIKKKEGISIPKDLRRHLFNSEEDFQILLPYCHHSLYALPPIAPENFKFSYASSQKINSESHLIIDLKDDTFVFNGKMVSSEKKKTQALANLKELTEVSLEKFVKSKRVSERDLSDLFNRGFGPDSDTVKIFEKHVHKKVEGKRNVWYRIKGDVIVIPKNKP